VFQVLDLGGHQYFPHHRRLHVPPLRLEIWVPAVVYYSVLLGAPHAPTIKRMFFHRLDLAGARAIVTGASSGIGHALALRLAEQRVRWVLASRNRERLEALAAAIRQRNGEAHVVPTDVADPAQRAHLIETAVSTLGGLDILINNAGVGALGPFAEAS